MILLTGGTGLVGGHLVKRLVAAGEKVRCLVRKGSELRHLEELGVELCPGDLLTPGSLREALEDVDQIIHLAGILRERGEAVFERVNVEGTRSLIQAASKAGIKRFIFVSVIGARPDPAFPFTFSKWKGEEAIRGSGLPFTILQPSAIFGEGDRFITVLARMVRFFPLVPIVGGKNRLQPVWVGDVASCILKVLSDGRWLGRTLPVGGPEPFTFEGIVRLILKTLGLRRLTCPLPHAVLHLLPTSSLAPGLLELFRFEAVVEPELLRRVFGVQPMPLFEGIEYILRSKLEGRTRSKEAASRPARQKG